MIATIRRNTFKRRNFLFFFLIGIIFIASFPLCFAATENLYVNALDNTYTDWTPLGTTPYLDAVDAGTIKTKSAGTHGWFDFPATTFTSITSVNAFIYCLQWDGDVNIEFEWTGDTTAETNIQTTGSISTWVDLGTVSNLDTVAEVDACRIRCVWAAGKNQWVEIDAFYLYVDGTAASGQNVTETLYATASASSTLSINIGLGYGMTATAAASGSHALAIEKGAFLSESSYVLTSMTAGIEAGVLLFEFLGVETASASSQLLNFKALGYSLTTDINVNDAITTAKEMLIIYGETMTAQIEVISQKEVTINLYETIYETPTITAVLYWTTDEAQADNWFLIAALLLIIVLILLALMFSGVIS